MTFKEFRAWLEGFEESFAFDGEDQAPNSFQYSKIKQKLNSVEKDLNKPVYRVGTSPNIWETNLSRTAAVPYPEKSYTIT